MQKLEHIVDECLPNQPYSFCVHRFDKLKNKKENNSISLFIFPNAENCVYCVLATT